MFEDLPDPFEVDILPTFEDTAACRAPPKVLHTQLCDAATVRDPIVPAVD